MTLPATRAAGRMCPASAPPGSFGRAGWQALLPPALVALGNLLVFFRHSLISGFAQVSGDSRDGRLVMSIMEHWRHVLALEAHWRTPNYFHPASDVLGYTDALFLHGLIYSLFRALGAGWLASYELAAMALKLAGFFGFYALARRGLGLKRGPSLLGASLFFQLNATAVSLGHIQLLTVNLAPILLALAIWLVRRLRAGDRPAAFLLGLAGLALYAAMAMSGFYMAWYLALWASVAAIGFVLMDPVGMAGALGPALRRLGWVLPALMLAAIPLNLPLALTYGPTAAETGMHKMAALAEFTGTPADIVNVGSANLVWSPILQRASMWLLGHPMHGGEQASGITPGLLLLGLAGAVSGLRRPDRLGLSRRAVAAALLGLALPWLASFRIGSFVGWDYIFDYFPGGRATRVPARYQIFAGMLVVLAASVLLDRLRWLERPPRLAAAGLVLLLGQMNLGFGMGMRAAEEARLLRALPAPPAGCRAFFVSRAMARSDGTPELRGAYDHNVDAMVVAERFLIPTLNGASTFSPRAWTLGGPPPPDYLDRVMRYARDQGVTDGLCSLDAEAGRWQTVSAN